MSTSTITTQRSHRVPSGMTCIINQDSIEVYSKEVDGKFLVMGFAGKRTRPDFYYRFTTKERMNEYISKWRTNLENHNERVIARRKERSAPHTLKVDDIMVCSWGYEQTNIDYYQITKLIGSTMVEIRQIQEEVVGQSGYHNKVVPMKDNFIQPRWEGDTYRCLPMRKKVKNGNSVSVYSFANAYKWDGRPKEETMLGYGH